MGRDVKGMGNDATTVLMLRCVLCNSTSLTPILSMGDLPLPNRLPLDTDGPDNRYPLGLQLCLTCGLLQLTHAVPPEDMFSADYTYIPSTSTTIRRHFEELARTVHSRTGQAKEGFVVDIGSNDGLLLSFFKALGYRVMGIDPAESVAGDAMDLYGIFTVTKFFTEAVGREYSGLADVITATNCMAHTSNLRSYLRGVKEMLAPDGVFVVEVPYVWTMLSNLSFDLIYHEHQSYFGVMPLYQELPNFGLKLETAELVNSQGGSLRLWIRHDDGKANQINLAGHEIARNWTRPTEYLDFAYRVTRYRDAAVRFIDSLRPSRNVIAGFGASAKAAVILNYCGIQGSRIQWIADGNTRKQGRLIPGVRIPIVSEQQLYQHPDYVVNFVPNLTDDVIRKVNVATPGSKIVNMLPVPYVL